MKNYDEQLLNRVDMLLKSKNISRKQMCEDLKLNYGAVASWFTRKSFGGDFSTLDKIANYLQSSTEYILYGTKMYKNAKPEEVHPYLIQIDGKGERYEYLLSEEDLKIVHPIIKKLQKESKERM